MVSWRCSDWFSLTPPVGQSSTMEKKGKGKKEGERKGREKKKKKRRGEGKKREKTFIYALIPERSTTCRYSWILGDGGGIFGIEGAEYFLSRILSLIFRLS